MLVLVYFVIIKVEYFMRHKSNTDRVKKLNYQPVLLKKYEPEFSRCLTYTAILA
jgi:hypothetical protein